MANGTFTLDLTNFKDRVGSRVQPGRYRVVIDDTEMDQARSGNQMINVWYRILDDGEFKDQTITDRLVLTEKALFRVVGLMNAIGLPTPKKRLQLNLKQFNGKVLEIEVEDGEPYNGRVKSEVRGYLRASKGKAAQSEDLDLADAGDAEEATTGASEDTSEDALFPSTEGGDDSEVDLDNLGDL